MSKIEVLCLFIAFVGVYALISPKDSIEGDAATEILKSNIELWPLFMCILGPMLMATTNICLRYMKGLHEYTASTYPVIFSVVFFGISLPATGTPITIMDSFAGYEYLILIFVALAGGVGMICKTKAFQYEKAGRLGMLSYLSIIFTFLFDLILIGTEFKPAEIPGILIILSANIISAFMVFHNNFMIIKK